MVGANKLGLEGAFGVDFVHIGEAKCCSFSHQHHGTSVSPAVIMNCMGSINPPSYGCKDVSSEIEFHMASAVEITEDLFEFALVVFVWAFHACCEEGDGHLNIPSSLFA